MPNAKVTKTADEAIKVSFNNSTEWLLRPVQMSTRPSDNPAAWLRFQGQHVPGTQLSDAMAAQLQMFMRAHRTEAVTDGQREYTLAGSMLALCDTSAVK